METQAPQRRSDAYIIRHVDDGGEPKYLVRPSCVVLDGNGSRRFRIRNLTGVTEVVVDLGGGAEPTPGEEPRIRKGEYDAFEFTVNTQAPYLDYHVTVGGEVARGESDPVIIIDPPAS